jgi:hypothetical protein
MSTFPVNKLLDIAVIAWAALGYIYCSISFEGMPQKDILKTKAASYFKNAKLVTKSIIEFHGVLNSVWARNSCVGTQEVLFHVLECSILGVQLKDGEFKLNKKLLSLSQTFLKEDLDMDPSQFLPNSLKGELSEDNSTVGELLASKVKDAQSVPNDSLKEISQDTDSADVTPDTTHEDSVKDDTSTAELDDAKGTED